MIALQKNGMGEGSVLRRTCVSEIWNISMIFFVLFFFKILIISVSLPRLKKSRINNGATEKKFERVFALTAILDWWNQYRKQRQRHFCRWFIFIGNPWILMQVKRTFFRKDEKKNSHLSLNTLLNSTEIAFQTSRVPLFVVFHFATFCLFVAHQYCSNYWSHSHKFIS